MSCLGAIGRRLVRGMSADTAMEIFRGTETGGFGVCMKEVRSEGWRRLLSRLMAEGGFAFDRALSVEVCGFADSLTDLCSSLVDG